MRITDGLLIQQVGADRLVFVDDNTGTEAVVMIDAIPAIANNLATAQQAAQLSVTVYGLLGVDIDIPMSAYPQAAFALGYFWGVARS